MAWRNQPPTVRALLSFQLVKTLTSPCFAPVLRAGIRFFFPKLPVSSAPLSSFPFSANKKICFLHRNRHSVSVQMMSISRIFFLCAQFVVILRAHLQGLHNQSLNLYRPLKGAP
jgi:hypothetical protein